MSLEFTLAGLEFSLFQNTHRTVTVTAQSLSWWPITQIILASLLAMYLVGWLEDFRRVRDLKAEPSSTQKVIIITKNEAWERIHPRRAHARLWATAVPARRQEIARTDPPVDDGVMLTGSEF